MESSIFSKNDLHTVQKVLSFKFLLNESINYFDNLLSIWFSEIFKIFENLICKII